MESDRLVDAEATIERRAPHSSKHNDASLSRGRELAAASGGLDLDADDEDTPLLARGGGRHNEHSDDECGKHGSESGWSGEEEFAALSSWRRPSIIWLLPALLLSTVAYGAIIVPKLNIILNLICNNHFAQRAIEEPGFSYKPVDLASDHDPRCTGNADIQAATSKFMLAIQVITGLLSAITTPKLGSLSDRYGRVKIFVVGSVGVVVGELITILTAKFTDRVSINWMLFGSVIDGLCGSFILTMAIANAYATDCTPPSRRGVVFGWIHGCLFIGIAIGPLLAAQVIQAAGSVLTIFYVAMAAHAAIMIYIGLVVPESLSRKRQLIARSRKDTMAAKVSSTNEDISFIASIVYRFLRGGGLFTPLSILWPTGPKTTPDLRRNLVLLASVDTVQFGVAMGAMTIITLYTEYRFDWGTVEVSYLIAIVNVCRVVVLLLIFPGITRLVRGKVDPTKPKKNTGCDWLDLVIIWVSMLFDTMAQIGYSTANVGAVFIFAGCITSLGGMGSPTSQSSLTKHVPADRVGQILGAVGLLHGLARVVSPLVFNSIYASTVKSFPQAVFVFFAGAYGVAFLLSLFIRPHVYISEDDEDLDDR